MTNIDDLIDLLDDLIDDSPKLPLTGGKRAVDVTRALEIIDEIRLNMPLEIKQAKAIVADRAEIISQAKSEAETIVSRAEDRARAILDKDELVRRAEERSNEILSATQTRSREIKRATNDFAEDVLKTLEEALVKNVNDVRQARSTIRSKKLNVSKPAEQE